MKNLIKIIDFGIKSSVWVSVSVTALVAVTCIILEIRINSNLLIFVFFGTIFGYNFIKYFEKAQINNLKCAEGYFDLNKKVKQFKKLKVREKLIFQLSVISALICCVCVYSFKINTQLWVIIPLVLTFGYAVSFGYKTLRNISGLKIYVVAIVWVFVSVLLPIIESEIELSTDVWIILFQRFIFVVVLILPFEIRDLSIDDEILRTLPQNIGVRNTKLYGLLLLMAFYFLEFFKDELLEVNLVIMSLVFLITLLFLVLAKEKQSKYYSSFFVEGIPILWLVLLLVF